MAPDLGATFVPSGFDDYYMPEVVAPAPQRYVCPDSCFCSYACWLGRSRSRSLAADPLARR